MVEHRIQVAVVIGQAAALVGRMMVQEVLIAPIIIIKVQDHRCRHQKVVMVVVHHLMEVKVVNAGMMAMTKAAMAVLAVAAAADQIIWALPAAAAILVEAVIEAVIRITELAAAADPIVATNQVESVLKM